MGKCSIMFRGFRECIILEKEKTALRNLEDHKVLLKDPLGPNEGPWLVMDPVGAALVSLESLHMIFDG